MKFIDKLYLTFKQEYRTAPYWQKVVLVILSAVLIYALILWPMLSMYRGQYRRLENQRKELTRNLQKNKSLVDEGFYVRKKYQQTQLKLQPELLGKNELKQQVSKIVHNYSWLVYQLETKQVQEYTLLEVVMLSLKVKVIPAKSLQLLQELIATIDYGRIQSLDYVDGVLTLELECLLAKNPVRKLQPVLKTQIVLPRLNGFYISGKVIKCFCNGRLYAVGDKCGNYTIISIDVKKRMVVLRAGARTYSLRPVRE